MLPIKIPRKEYNPFTKEELEKIHTKTLFKWLKQARFCRCENAEFGEHKYDCLKYYDKHTFKFATRTQLKEILDTREHIPNKPERKAARQARAKQRY